MKKSDPYKEELCKRIDELHESIEDINIDIDQMEMKIAVLVEARGQIYRDIRKINQDINERM